MIKARSTTLEQRGDDDHTQLLGQMAKEISGGAWNGLCQVEVVDTFHLTKVQGVMQFLQYNEFSALLSQLAYLGGQMLHVLLDISHVLLLYQSYLLLHGATM